MYGVKQDDANVKQQLKGNLKRMINESDVSLESVRTDSVVSGEYIEV